MRRLQLFQTAFKKGCTPLSVTTGETRVYIHSHIMNSVCVCVCVCACAGFHGLVYDLLRRCVCGELGADETAAFFTDLTSSLVCK